MNFEASIRRFATRRSQMHFSYFYRSMTIEVPEHHYHVFCPETYLANNWLRFFTLWAMGFRVSRWISCCHFHLIKPWLESGYLLVQKKTLAHQITTNRHVYKVKWQKIKTNWLDVQGGSGNKKRVQSTIKTAFEDFFRGRINNFGRQLGPRLDNGDRKRNLWPAKGDSWWLSLRCWPREVGFAGVSKNSSIGWFTLPWISRRWTNVGRPSISSREFGTPTACIKCQN